METLFFEFHARSANVALVVCPASRQVISQSNTFMKMVLILGIDLTTVPRHFKCGQLNKEFGRIWMEFERTHFGCLDVA
jgi:hypothetical protein